MAAQVKAQPPTSLLVFDVVLDLTARDRLIARDAGVSRSVATLDLFRHHDWQLAVLDALADA
jgi:hypothetical protein